MDAGRVRVTSLLLMIVLGIIVSTEGRAQTIFDAVQQGNLARVRRFLQADRRYANEIGPYGNQPLHTAADSGRLEVVRMLVAAGADVNGIGRRQDRWTPLFNAVTHGQTDVVRFLLANGAAVDPKDNIGNTPLAFAADNRAEIAEILLAAGANANDRRQPQDGWTPMFTAVHHSALDAMRVLMRHAADLDLRANNGDAVIHLAARTGADRALALLLSSGQRIETPNADGDTPLMVAAAAGQMGMGRFLLGVGAEIDARNKAGRTAADEALRNNQPAFAEMIQNYRLVLSTRPLFDQAAKTMRAGLRSGYLNWSSPSTQATRVYYADFSEDRVGAEWTTYPQPGAQQGGLRVSTTPRGGRRFLGELGSQIVRLSLADLPPHREVSLYFDLYILRTWDGNNLNAGPDVWSLSLPDGPILLRTTFCNTVGILNSNVRMQAFPGEYPGDHNECQDGAVEKNTLGYTGEIEGKQVPMDTVYRLSYTLPHTGSTLKLDFAATGLEPLDNESWGLTNVRVSVGAPGHPVATVVHAGHPTKAIPAARRTGTRLTALHGRRAVSAPAKRKGTGASTARLHAKERPPTP